jgi:hypothetical protein
MKTITKLTIGLITVGLISCSKVVLANSPLPATESIASLYEELKNLVSQERWEEANTVTTKIVLKIADREEEGWLDGESIENFPCEEIGAIHNIWTRRGAGPFDYYRGGVDALEEIRESEIPPKCDGRFTLGEVLLGL